MTPKFGRHRRLSGEFEYSEYSDVLENQENLQNSADTEVSGDQGHL